ncbi:hypothetical protein HMI59_23810 (plasmid) [Paenarthrobacter sp. YJN-5]|nr:hypothetical protein HMI59_23810 [Paenarthrobacter sp. YJN-5]
MPHTWREETGGRRPEQEENPLNTTPDKPLGYVTIRIPIRSVTERESWEIPEEYTYLEPGEAELISHDMPAGWHESLREQLIESGIYLAQWTAEEVAAACTRPAEPPKPVRTLDLFGFQTAAK